MTLDATVGQKHHVSALLSLDTNQLLDDIKPYEHQIGGHGMGSVKKPMLVCSTSTSLVFKRVQQYPKGQNEVDFYELVFKPSASSSSPTADTDGCDRSIRDLQHFLPQYHGLFSTIDSSPVCHYLGLSDLLHGLVRPAVCDVKIGCQLCPPDLLTSIKAARQQEKYPWQHQLGFSLTGFKIYDANGLEKVTNKQYGPFLRPDQICDQGIGLFLGSNRKRALALAHLFLRLLTQLIDFIACLSTSSRQPQLEFYASSLVLAYDDAAEQMDIGSHASPGNVRLAIVDFTRHTRTNQQLIRANGSSIMVDRVPGSNVDADIVNDEKHNNFLQGVQSLASYFTAYLTLNSLDQ